MYNINLFGGPGTGKSTTAAGLFAQMKEMGYKVELTTEFAKDLVYEESFKVLQDQLLVTATQNHKSFRLHGKVDYAIHDSPVLLGAVYSRYIGKLGVAYEEFLVELFKSYNGINVFLVRDVKAHPYQAYGRNQNLDEAILLDEQLKNLLKKHSLPYIEVPMACAVSTIYEEVVLKGNTWKN